VKACYCCRRNEDEIRNELLRLIQEDYDDEDKFVRMEMEEEDKKALDLQEEWESLKKKAAAGMADIFSVDVFSILRGGPSVEANALGAFIKNAEKALGGTLANISPNSIESEIRDKIEKIKNLNDYNERMVASKRRYESARESIMKEKSWFAKKSVRIGESSQEIAICRICSSSL
jgi:hypothetical protein